MLFRIYIFIFNVIIWAPAFVGGRIIEIPSQYPTIQEGIQLAANGDTVLLAPGIYREQLTLQAKAVTLASWYLTRDDTSYIRQTIVDGDSQTVINIENSVAFPMCIIGITIRNGEDGIFSKAKFNISHCYITACQDGIDYEDGSGGICRHNLFEHNEDDAIDLDQAVDIIVAENVIRYNQDDGIEIRLHEYKGPQLNYIIQNNIIYGNEEDGIQFIDYPDTSNRVFRLERNLIYDNAMAAIGCMSDGNSDENYEAAGIPEPIYLINNTIINHQCGVAGGAYLVAINNVITQSSITAMKKVIGNSIVTNNDFWANGVDFDSCNTAALRNKFENPMLNESFHLMEGSPCIDAGIKLFIWQGDTLLNLLAEAYQGAAPDMGAFEYLPESGMGSQSMGLNNFQLEQNYPNPFNARTKINFRVESSAFVDLSIYNTIGQTVKLLYSGMVTPGEYGVVWDGTEESGKQVAAGIYVYRFEYGNHLSSGTARTVQTRKMNLIR